MSARPATGRYGNRLDVSTADYVECVTCSQRWVGGTFQRRVQKWSEHAEESGCHAATARRLQELSEQN